MVGHHLTIRDVSVMEGDRDLYYRQFLDDFNDEADRKSLLISEEPARSDDWVFDCRLAAAAELIARRSGIDVPGWTQDPYYFLDHEVWGLNNLCSDPAREDVREYLRNTTPEPFRKRGLMYGENVTKRV